MRCRHPKRNRTEITPVLIWCSACGAVRYSVDPVRWLHPFSTAAGSSVRTAVRRNVKRKR